MKQGYELREQGEEGGLKREVIFFRMDTHTHTKYIGTAKHCGLTL